MNRIARNIAGALILSSLVFNGCHKGAPAGGSTNSEEAKKNAELERTAPHMAQTVLGSAERINMAVGSAIDAHRQQNWAQVSGYLQAARHETEKALADLPEKKKAGAMRRAFEEMGADLDRAIQAVDNRPKGFDAQLAELQTRAMSLKLSAPQSVAAP